MTSPELSLLQRSANLCTQYNQLLNQIQRVKAEKNSYEQKLPRDPAHAAKAAGNAAVKNRLIPPIWVWCVAMGAFIVPFIICAAIYKIAEINNEYFLLIGECAGFVTFCLALIYFRKVDREKVRKRAEVNYMAEYNQSRQRNQAQCSHLNKQLYTLTQQYRALTNKMQDSNQCCIPASHWYHGQDLYRLVNSKRASTLQEAIAIQSQIEARDAAYWNSVRNYPRQVEAQIAKDKMQFLDDMEKMAKLGMELYDN